MALNNHEKEAHGQSQEVNDYELKITSLRELGRQSNPLGCSWFIERSQPRI